MALKIQTIKDIKRYLSEELSGLYPETELSAFASLIRSKMNLSGIQSVAFPDTPIAAKNAAEIERICTELKKGRPIQYVLGETNFYNCTLKVNESALIPRPETEELVDRILKENKGFKGSIIDIGTGSGAIAIALAVNLPGSSVIATDISDKALELARENARLNNAQVTFIRSDIFSIDTSLFPRAGIIVSNPPYIMESEKKSMHNNVLGFEPHSALFVPDNDPLIYYRAILDFAGNYLSAGGKVYLEINELMGKEMTELTDSSGYTSVRLLNDINGRNRFITGIKNG